MPRPEIRPREAESPFGVAELFFSTTDRRGIIRSGNRVFTRVSGWDASELVGQSHNWVRHPDMPRVVFELFWDTIQAGKPIAAYVKNLAKDGSYYWVVATVVPYKDGYLSVRFKPVSPTFAAVQELYAKLRQIEIGVETATGSPKKAIAASRPVLDEALRELGFADYTAFMHTFLPAEMTERDRILREQGSLRRHAAVHGKDAVMDGVDHANDEIRHHLDGLFASLDQFLGLNRDLEGKSEYIHSLAREIQLLSLNASVSANHLSHSGRSLRVVSLIMTGHAKESGELIDSLAEEIASTLGVLRDLAFRVSVARVQAESVGEFIAELRASDDQQAMAQAVGDPVVAVRLLSLCLEDGIAAVAEAFGGIDQGLRRLATRIGHLRSVLRTLDMVNTSGRVEVSRLSAQGAFGNLFQESADRINEALGQMNALSATVNTTRQRSTEAVLADSQVLEAVSSMRQWVERMERARQAA